MYNIKLENDIIIIGNDENKEPLLFDMHELLNTSFYEDVTRHTKLLSGVQYTDLPKALTYLKQLIDTTYEKYMKSTFSSVYLHFPDAQTVDAFKDPTLLRDQLTDSRFADMLRDEFNCFTPVQNIKQVLKTGVNALISLAYLTKKDNKLDINAQKIKDGVENTSKFIYKHDYYKAIIFKPSMTVKTYMHLKETLPVIEKELVSIHNTISHSQTLKQSIDARHTNIVENAISQENASKAIQKLIAVYEKDTPNIVFAGEFTTHLNETKQQILEIFHKYGDEFSIRAIQDAILNTDPKKIRAFKNDYTCLVPEDKKVLISVKIDSETLKLKNVALHREAVIDYEKLLTYKALMQDNDLSTISNLDMARDIITMLQHKSGLSNEDSIKKIIAVNEKRICSYISQEELNIINARFNQARVYNGKAPLIPSESISTFIESIEEIDATSADTNMSV